MLCYLSCGRGALFLSSFILTHLCHDAFDRTTCCLFPVSIIIKMDTQSVSFGFSRQDRDVCDAFLYRCGTFCFHRRNGVDDPLFCPLQAGDGVLYRRSRNRWSSWIAGTATKYAHGLAAHLIFYLGTPRQHICSTPTRGLPKRHR